MLEQLCHRQSSFITLTYDDKHLPEGGTLVREHYQNFLKSLRKHYPPEAIRFYFVGEYGEKNFRPHYHAALFGHGGCQLVGSDERTRRTCQCPSCALIRRTWAKGNTDNAYLTRESAQYLAGYTVKKMTGKNDPRLGGRLPEFGQPSLKPGIGALAVPNIAATLTSDAGAQSIIDTGDVPLNLRMGAKNLPLGRYLRQKLREELGHDKKTPEEMLLSVQAENAALLAAELQKPENLSKAVKTILLDLNRQKVLNFETKNRIFSKKGKM